MRGSDHLNDLNRARCRSPANATSTGHIVVSRQGEQVLRRGRRLQRRSPCLDTTIHGIGAGVVPQEEMPH